MTGSHKTWIRVAIYAFGVALAVLADWLIDVVGLTRALHFAVGCFLGWNVRRVADYVIDDLNESRDEQKGREL